MQFLFSCTKDEPVTDDVITKITGLWKVAETNAALETDHYEVTISKTSEMTVSLKNFFGDMLIDAEVEGLKLTIPSQTVSGFVVSGTGAISDNYKKIDWTYTLTDENGPESYTAIYTRN
jgi:hypothetical protein